MLAVAKNFHLLSQNLYANPMPNPQHYVSVPDVLQCGGKVISVIF